MTSLATPLDLKIEERVSQACCLGDFSVAETEREKIFMENEIGKPFATTSMILGILAVVFINELARRLLPSGGR